MTIIRSMTIEDFDAVHALWLKTEYLELNECDTREGIALYLNRNPGLCFVAEDKQGLIIANVLCGHDGRRGFLRHLAVAAEHRGSGLARRLVDCVLDALAQQGIGKCNIFVDDANVPGFSFWEHLGWVRLEETFRMLQKPAL